MIDESVAHAMQQFENRRFRGKLVPLVILVPIMASINWKLGQPWTNPLSAPAAIAASFIAPGIILLLVTSQSARLAPRFLRPRRTVSSGSIVYSRSRLQGTLIWLPVLSGVLGFSGLLVIAGNYLHGGLGLLSLLLIIIYAPRGAEVVTITSKGVTARSDSTMGSVVERAYQDITDVEINQGGALVISGSGSSSRIRRNGTRVAVYDDHVIVPLVVDPDQVLSMAYDIQRVAVHPRPQE